MKVKQKKGISLIVLVITIIVMIILATAIILSLNGSGIIGKAKEAKTATNMSIAKEVLAVAKAEWDLMSDKEKEEATRTEGKEEGNSRYSTFAMNRLSSAGFITGTETGAIQVTDEGKINIVPIIPKGFVPSIYEGEMEVEEGLVIYETTALSGINHEIAMESYNQYVWIPVPIFDEFVREDGYLNGHLDSSVSNKGATEPSSYNGSTEYQYDTEAEDYEKMMQSVKKYGGFYIARYEAGDLEATETNIARTTYTTSSTVITRKNAHVYNYVPWGESMTSTGPVTVKSTGEKIYGAVHLSQKAYEYVEGNAVSTLCYGVQWDAVMRFMEDIQNPSVSDKRYIENSTNMGWYGNNKTNNSEKKTGVDVNVDIDKDGTVDIIATNKVKNIYDMAGNVSEWTMEASSKEKRIHRGGPGSSSIGGYSEPASCRQNASPSTYSGSLRGFRVALYLK